jgi:hypothetical protein
LKFEEEGGGKDSDQGFFYRERGKELFWDSEKIKGSKEKRE